MKSIIRLILLHLFTFSPFLASAYDVEVDGIFYGIMGTRSAYVTHSGWRAEDGESIVKYTGDVVVPSQISYGGRTYPVTSVDENAFAGCDELTSVRLPQTLRAVSACAFLGCTSLRQVSLPATIRAFGGCAFTGCTSLQQIMLPRHTEVVDSFTFYCCASLTSVVLPYRTRTVCQGALEHLPAMTDLYCFASLPPLAEQGAFTLADQQQCTLHVPAEALPLYRESPVWSDFCRVVALGDDDYIGQGYQRGDINDDGLINTDDLALLRRLIVSLPDDAALRWAADVNADGIVNSIDYVILAKRCR